MKRQQPRRPARIVRQRAICLRPKRHGTARAGTPRRSGITPIRRQRTTSASRRLVLSKSFALARLRVAFLRASLIREDIRAVGLALAGDLITPEQALDRFDDIMQPELS